MKSADATGTVRYELDLGELDANGVPPAPDETRIYQFQYRFQDPTNPDGLALSAAVRVTFE